MVVGAVKNGNGLGDRFAITDAGHNLTAPVTYRIVKLDVRIFGENRVDVSGCFD